MVVHRFPRQRLRRLKLESHAFLHLVTEPVEPVVGDRVFEAGVAPVCAVAEIALDGHHLACDADDLIRLYEAQRLRHGDKRLRLVVSPAQAASDQHVEPAHRPVRRPHGHDGQVVRVDVDAVVAFERDCRLELAREVLLAVEGLDLRLRGLDDLAVEPDLVIGAGLRCELGHHGRDRPMDIGVKPVGDRLRAAHDVALDVAAASQCRQQSVIDRSDGFLDVAFDHAVELKVLAGRHAQRSVGPAPADVVVGDVCVGGHDTARNTRPDHQLVVLVQPLGASLLTAVPVVLLVDAVELEKLLGGVAEGRRVFQELLFDEPPQVIARGLDGLVLRQAVEDREIREIRQQMRLRLMC